MSDPCRAPGANCGYGAVRSDPERLCRLHALDRDVPGWRTMGTLEFLEAVKRTRPKKQPAVTP